MIKSEPFQTLQLTIVEDNNHDKVEDYFSDIIDDAGKKFNLSGHMRGANCHTHLETTKHAEVCVVEIIADFKVATSRFLHNEVYPNFPTMKDELYIRKYWMKELNQSLLLHKAHYEDTSIEVELKLTITPRKLKLIHDVSK